MSKTVWTIALMGFVTLLLVTIAMVMSLTQFQETPSSEWVRLAEQITTEFKAQNVSVRVNLNVPPGSLRIGYLAGIHSNYSLEAQNAEMQRVAQFAAANYKGKDMRYVREVKVTRTETHGRGCFQTTYEGSFTLPVTPRLTDRFQQPPRPPEDAPPPLKRNSHSAPRSWPRLKNRRSAPPPSAGGAPSARLFGRGLVEWRT